MINISKLIYFQVWLAQNMQMDYKECFKNNTIVDPQLSSPQNLRIENDCSTLEYFKYRCASYKSIKEFNIWTIRTLLSLPESKGFR